MESLHKATSFTLEWAQTGMFENSYELRGGDRLMATLSWEKAFGSLATAHTRDGTWTFKRSGFLTPFVTARVSGSERDIAAYKPEMGGGGELTLGGKRDFAWKRRGFWSGHWGFDRIGGGPILHFEPKFSMLKRVAEMHLEPSAHTVPELPLLAALGWYLLILMGRDQAATMAIIAAS